MIRLDSCLMCCALLILTALVSGCAPKPTTPASEDPLGVELDAFFAPWNRTDSPGAAVVILKDGEPLYRLGFGVADLETGDRITPHGTQLDLLGLRFERVER